MSFKRFEAEGVGSLDDLISGIEDQLESEGLNGSNEEGETILFLRNNSLGKDGIRDWSAIVYNGATIAEVVTDLNTRQ
jgi:hypothetical protein